MAGKRGGRSGAGGAEERSESVPSPGLASWEGAARARGGMALRGIMPLPSKAETLGLVRRLRGGAGRIGGELGAPLGLSQPTVSKILKGVREARYEELAGFLNLLLERLSPLPPSIEVGEVASMKGLVSVRPEEEVREAARRLWEGGFTQLPVIDAEGWCVGIVTDASILERLLFPPRARLSSWLQELARMSVREAGLVEQAPALPRSAQWARPPACCCTTTLSWCRRRAGSRA